MLGASTQNAGLALVVTWLVASFTVTGCVQDLPRSRFATPAEKADVAVAADADVGSDAADTADADALAPDTLAADAADAAPDVAPDVAVEPDIAPDVAADVAPDVAVAPDAAPDVAPDVPADVAVAPDVAPDVPPDVPPDLCQNASCDDGDPCTTDSCVPATGCAHAKAAGANCDDGNACTESDKCLSSGTCAGTTIACNDNNVCTDDTCNPGSGCAYQPNTSACDDGSLCSSGDKCSATLCLGTAVNCDDGKDCTTDICDPGSGCKHVANTQPCSDGNACTTGDACGGGSCIGAAANCDDGNACTSDSCDPGSGCKHLANALPCSDGSVCTLNDVCQTGVCKSGTAKDCSDGDACTVDACDAATDCKHVFTPNSNAETCNAKDDNCNGQTDENAIDAKNWYLDADGDGYGAADSIKACAATGNYKASDKGDCDDSKGAVHPGATELCNAIDDNCDGKTDEQGATGCTSFYKDSDLDDYGVTADLKCLCKFAAPYSATKSGDCDDTKAAVHPNSVELCNGLDDNCNGITDSDSQQAKAHYLDNDGDGWGNSGNYSQLCAPQGLYSALQGGDCDDNKSTVHPGAVEKCNGVDDNCDGKVDESNAVGCTVYFWDADSDGYGVTGTSACLCASTAGGYSALQGGDCADGKSSVNPGASEVCGDAIDNNCNGQVDEENAVGCTMLLADNDGDGFGATGTGKCLCAPLPPYNTAEGGDCNDANGNVHPGAQEACNSVDDDCDGLLDEGTPCDDGNGCTADSCSGGNCVYASAGDGLACGLGGACVATTCVGVNVPAGMVIIPAGTFWMGCNASKDAGCQVDESPQHKVTLSAYYMDQTETTVAQYKACVDAGACSVPGGDTISTDCNWDAVNAKAKTGREQHPVNCVNWAQSQAYCQWRGTGFDLPTEAQWEMAARGSCEKNGSAANNPACAQAMRRYPWGDATAECFYAVLFDGNVNGCGQNSTWVVGQKMAGDSPYGLHDMAGNVWEWVRDWYPTAAPWYPSADQTDPLGPTSASGRIKRGGGFVNDATYLRAGNRFSYSPSGAYSDLGLRCSRTYP